MSIKARNQRLRDMWYTKEELKRLSVQPKTLKKPKEPKKPRNNKWKLALQMELGLIPKYRRKVKRRNGVLYWTY